MIKVCVYVCVRACAYDLHKQLLAFALIYTYILILIGTSKPALKDLYQHFTPQYAAHWKVIGAILGLSSGTLDIIQYDNQCKAEPCCNDMLKKWLQVDITASWEKLFTIIESPAVSSSEAINKGTL